MIGCATCSLSQRHMQKVLLPYFILVVSSWFKPRVCHITKLWACINRVDTFMCPYALPIIQIPYPFSSLCLSCNLSSSLRSLHLVKHQRAHLAREVQQGEPTDKTRQRYLLRRRNTCSSSYEKPRRVQEEQMKQRHYWNNQDPCRSQKKPQTITNRQLQKKCQQHQHQQLQQLARMSREDYRRIWSQTQDGLMVTE